MSANGNSERRVIEERRSDIRFFIFALLFYLLSWVFTFAVGPATYPMLRSLMKSYLSRTIEETYSNPPPTFEESTSEEDSILLKDPWWEAQDELLKSGKLVVIDNETGEPMTVDIKTGETAPLEEKYRAVFKEDSEASEETGEDSSSSEENHDEQDAKNEKEH